MTNDTHKEQSGPTPSGARSPAVDAAGRFAESVLCRGCGYDLMGLAPSAGCPECALPAARSVRGDLLSHGDPDWLRGMRRGTRQAAWGSAVALSLVLLFTVLSAVLTAVGRLDWFGTATVAVGLATTVTSVVIVLGVWMLTVPEAVRQESEHPLAARRLARIGAIAYVVATPMQIVLGGPGGLTRFAGIQATAASILAVLVTLLSLLAIAGWVGLLVYIAQLARRAAAPRLALQASIAKWGYGVFGTITVVSMLPMAFFGPQVLGAQGGAPQRANIFLALVAVLGCGGTMLYLAFEAWFVAVLFQFAGRLERCAREAGGP